MLPKEKIIKATWNSFEGTKDVLINNVTTAIREGKIKVDSSTLPLLLSLLSASIEEGFQRGYSVFNKEVVAALTESSASPKKN